MTKRVNRRMLLGGAALVAIGAGAAGLIKTQSAEAALAPGAQAPNFSVVDARGQTRTLSEFAGRTLILEWTNHGCPYVGRVYGAGGMQDTQRAALAGDAAWLTVISSAPGEQGYLEGPAALAHAQSVDSEPTAILLDPSGDMGHAFGARTTPHIFIINGGGRIVYQGAIDDRPTARASTPLGENYVLAALDDLAAGRPVARAQTTPYGCSIKYAG